MVPEGWTLKRVGELFDAQLGKMLNKEAKQKEPQFPYLGNSNVQWGRFDLSDLKTMHFNERELMKFSLIPNDIIMCEGGEVGRCAVWQEIGQNIYYQKALHRLRTKGEILPDFFQAYMESISGTKLLDDYTTRTSIAHLTQEKLLSLPVRLPTLLEQKKIVGILATWDKAITTAEQLLANSQQQKKALMQKLLTGKKRLLDENGERFSGEWKEVRLKELLTEEKSRNRDNKIDRVLSVTNHSGFVLPEDQFSKRVASENVRNYKIVRKGQYGYNPSRLNVGSFARLDSYDNGLLSPMYVVFSVKEGLLCSDYFLNWMSSNEAKQRIVGSTQGSVRDSVGFDALCRLPFKLPLMDEQRKIASVLSISDGEIINLQQKIDALKQEKKALMQQLLTGKSRVKADEEAV
ncbi:restriction endonuclease subunit S [Aliidiomarina halalkaliphila]|uniref:Restriction endonuclease subunit S n=1 Tax=Aliidiomarina halalkaliphila TaxID=2593535 RepID=A0A552X1R4_9GAMM|nr:restriction endonuclease subunit S [Aliidiomarina halalkaliphila]TRW48925.1 restriction endonuclease subunit S [Aliidiomarina halalkaliphila]